MVLLLVMTLVSAAAAGVRYEQSQTGDYNVHLDLKNVEVLAFLDPGSLSLADYEYDYGEYTLKPPSNSNSSSWASNSTSAPSNSTAAPDNSTATLSNSTAAPSNSTAAPSNSEGETPDGGLKEGDSNNISSSESNSTPKPPRRCGAGFYRDQAGRCRRLRRPVNKLSGLIQQAKNRLSG